MPPRPWRPVLASATKCCAAEDAAVAPDGLARCRPQQSELSRRLASFRRLSSLANSPASGAAAGKGGGEAEAEAEAAAAGEVAGPLQLHSFGLGELRGVTHDFSASFLLGEGGFGAVYKGFVDAGMRPGLAAQPVAVKQLNAGGFQGHREWLAEVIFLGQFRHPHLVRLLGYCCEDEERLLVYEFMPRGSLENHLFRSTLLVALLRFSSPCLRWEFRTHHASIHHRLLQGSRRRCRGALGSRWPSAPPRASPSSTPPARPSSTGTSRPPTSCSTRSVVS